jgi:hypothetical protein
VDYGVPCLVFETTFDTQDDVDVWTYQGTYAGPDTVPSWDNEALLLRNFGSVTYSVDVDLAEFAEVQVYVKMSAHSMEGLEARSFVVSFDGFATTPQTIESVEDVEDFDDTGEVVTSSIQKFRSQNVAVWDSLDLRLVFTGADNDDHCYLYEVGVSAIKLPP